MRRAGLEPIIDICRARANDECGAATIDAVGRGALFVRIGLAPAADVGAGVGTLGTVGASLPASTSGRRRGTWFVVRIRR